MGVYRMAAMNERIEFLISVFVQLSEFAQLTLLISLIGLVIGFIIGTIVAVSRSVHIPILSQIFTIYVEIMRETPLFVQILFWHFGLPYLTGYQLQTDVWRSAILALGLNSGAYQSEIIRAGIEAIPHGQWEASFALGFTRFQIFRYIVLPQALRIVVPPLANEFINLILNSSLLSAIAFPELTYQGRQIWARTYRTADVLFVMMTYYFIMAFTLSRVMKRIENTLQIPGLGMQKL